MIKVLLPAKDIPLNSLVTKKTGEKIYTLRDRIRVFSEDGGPKEIISKDGARVLVAENGDANVVSGDTEILWYAEEYNLQSFLEGHEQ